MTAGVDPMLFHCPWKRGKAMSSIPQDILQDLITDLDIDSADLDEISLFVESFGDNDLIELFNTVVKTKESE